MEQVNKEYEVFLKLYPTTKNDINHSIKEKLTSEISEINIQINQLQNKKNDLEEKLKVTDKYLTSVLELNMHNYMHDIIGIGTENYKTTVYPKFITTYSSLYKLLLITTYEKLINEKNGVLENYENYKNKYRSWYNIFAELNSRYNHTPIYASNPNIKKISDLIQSFPELTDEERTYYSRTK